MPSREVQTRIRGHAPVSDILSAPIYQRSPMRIYQAKLHRIVLVMACLLCMAGCGQKGDLYLPETDTEDKQSEQGEEA